MFKKRIHKSKIQWIEFLEDDCTKYPQNSYLAKTKNKDKYIGQLILIDSSEITLSKPGHFDKKIPISELKSLKYHRQRIPMFGHQQSLFIAPTGFNLKKGDKLFKATGFIYNSIAHGISNNLSVNYGAFTFLPFARLKFAKSFSKYIHFSLGGGLMLPFGPEVGSSISIGTPDHFINVGVNYFNGPRFDDTKWEIEAFHLGGSIRIANRSRLFAEYYSYYFKETTYTAFEKEKRNFLSFGYAWFYKKGSIEINYSIDSQEEGRLRVCFKIENRIVEKLKMIDNQWFIANSAPFRSDIL